MGCSHNGCTCEDAPVTRNDMNFCSEECADAFDTDSSGPCPCDHPGCEGH